MPGITTIAKANKIIEQGLIVESKYIKRSEMTGSMTNLAIGFPEHIQNVRVLTIKDFDVQACGGTHVNNTRKIGKIEIVKFKNKGAKNRRIYCKLVN